MNNIFKKAANVISLVINGQSSCCREISLEDGYTMKYWLEKKNASTLTPLELVITDKLQAEKRIRMVDTMTADTMTGVVDQFNSGAMLKDIFPDIASVRDLASQLAKAETTLVYYQYHATGQGRTAFSTDLDRLLSIHKTRGLSYGS